MPIANVKTYIAIAVIVAISLFIGYLSYKNGALIKELDLTKMQLTEALVLNKEMSASIKLQNQAIDDLDKAAQLNKEKHALELKVARDNATKIKSEATKVFTKEVPPGLSDCEAGFYILNDWIYGDGK